MKRFILIFAIMFGSLGACAMRQTPSPNGFNTNTSANPIYYIPYAIDTPHGVNCTNGYGVSEVGNNEPDYDTLIGIANPTSTSQTARIRAYSQAGVLQTWSGVGYKDYALTAGHSVAMTFIPGNVFADAPQSWKGYATVESTTGGQLSVFAMQGGGGCFPAYWNTWSAALPVIPGPLAARSSSFLGYVIPHWSGDSNHPNGYATGVAATNFDSINVVFKFTYTVADFYTGVGTTYSFTKTVNANNSTSFDLYTELTGVGFAAATQEGWLRVDAFNTNGSPVAAKYAIYATIADSAHSVFSTGYGY